MQFAHLTSSNEQSNLIAGGIELIYEKNTIYILGISKISKNDPISAMYDIFFVGIILKRDSGEIIDSTCNMVRDVTTDFIRSILIGYNLLDDINEIIGEIEDRFYGMAQKAVIAAVKDARNKFMMIKGN
jgi:hypothetical protein